MLHPGIVPQVRRNPAPSVGPGRSSAPTTRRFLRSARPVRGRDRRSPPGRSPLMSAATCRIVEVAPRDGFQPIGPWIPTETKIAFLRRLAAVGLRRIEIGSFVSATAVPQLRDTAELIAAASGMPGLRPQVLVPTARREPRSGGGRGALPGLRPLRLGVAQPQQCPPLARRVRGGLRSPARRAAGRASRCGSTSPPLSIAPSTDGWRRPGARPARPSRGAAPRCRDLPLRHHGAGHARPRGAALRRGRGLPARTSRPGPTTRTTPTGSASPPPMPPTTRGCGCSTPPRAGWVAAPSHPAPPAMWRPRTSSGCSSAWGSPPASTSAPCSRWPRTPRRYRAPPPAAARATRCSPGSATCASPPEPGGRASA